MWSNTASMIQDASSAQLSVGEAAARKQQHGSSSTEAAFPPCSWCEIRYGTRARIHNSPPAFLLSCEFNPDEASKRGVLIAEIAHLRIWILADPSYREAREQHL